MSVPVENSKKLEKTFIYLLTLFNVDYNTQAAYALIKIDCDLMIELRRRRF